MPFSGPTGLTVTTVAPVLGDATQAANNVAKIQAALSAGGLIFLVGNGIAYINATLSISDNTTLVVSDGLTIKNVAAAPGTMIATKQYLSGVLTNVTLSWSSGVSVAAAWTGHGKSVGDPVFFTGSAPNYYNGVFAVDTVVDANNFTFIPVRQPTTSPTGQAKAMAANRNIAIRGGIWDYNSPTVQGAAPASIAIIGAFVRDIEIEDIQVQNVAKFCICFAGVRDYRVKNLYSSVTGSDGVKVYGPAYSGKVDGVYGTFGDDCVSIQSQETNPSWLAYNFAGGGDCIGFKCENIDAKTPANLSVVYIGLSTDFMQDIEFDGVHGNAPTGCGGLITVSAAAAGLKVSGVSYRNVDCFASQPIEVLGCTVDVLSLTNISPNMTTAAGAAIYVGSSATVNNLNVMTPPASLVGFPNSAANYVMLDGIVNNVTFSGGGIISNGVQPFTNMLLVRSGAQLRSATVLGGMYSGASNLFNNASGSVVVPKFSVQGAYLNVASIANFAASANISINNCFILNATNGILRTTGSVTVNWSMNGNDVSGGSYLAVVSGTPVVNPKGYDIQVDIGATGINRATGNRCIATASQGTIPAGSMVACQGTAAGSWFEQAVPANVY